MAENLVELTDANFTSTVEETSIPIMVDFWAPWCAPCRYLTPVVEELAGTFEGRIQVAKVNTDESPSVAAQYNIRSIPTLLFFKDGQVVDSHVGLIPKEQLQEKIEAIVGG